MKRSNAAEMWNSFLQLFQWKGIVRLALVAYKKLVEVHSFVTGNAVGKGIREPFSQEMLGLTILTRKEDRGDSSSVLNKVKDGKMITFECTPPRYATALVKKETPQLYENNKKYDPKLNDLNSEVKLTQQKIPGFQTAAELVRMREGKPKDVNFYRFPLYN